MPANARMATSFQLTGLVKISQVQVYCTIKYGADLVKTCSTGGVLSKDNKAGAPQYMVEELTTMTEETHSRGLKVASHAGGVEMIIKTLIAGAGTIEHARFIDDEGVRLAIENDNDSRTLKPCVS